MELGGSRFGLRLSHSPPRQARLSVFKSLGSPETTMIFRAPDFGLLAKGTQNQGKKGKGHRRATKRLNHQCRDSQGGGLRLVGPLNFSG